MLFPLIYWFPELSTLMRQLGPCFEDSLGWPFVISDCCYKLVCSPTEVDPGTSQLCQCVLSESTQHKEIPCSSLVPLQGRRWDEVVLDTQEITTIGCPQPTPCGWPAHSPCTLMWDAPAAIPRLWLHSVVCSCCVHIPVWLPVLQEEQKLHMQLLSKMPNYGVVFPLLSFASSLKAWSLSPMYRTMLSMHHEQNRQDD